MKIKITGKFIIAEEIPVEVKSGLILPSKQTNEGILKVVAAPKDSEFKANDKILLNSSWSQKIDYKDKEYSVVPFENIVGVLL